MFVVVIVTFAMRAGLRVSRACWIMGWWRECHGSRRNYISVVGFCVVLIVIAVPPALQALKMSPLLLATTTVPDYLFCGIKKLLLISFLFLLRHFVFARPVSSIRSFTTENGIGFAYRAHDVHPQPQLCRQQVQVPELFMISGCPSLH